ncbi:MAG: hypothetical protein U5L03_08680 [Burkholderiaceae bacterium]|nr:hypothetical protein [Burkholderiaceae bacterium]
MFYSYAPSGQVGAAPVERAPARGLSASPRPGCAAGVDDGSRPQPCQPVRNRTGDTLSGRNDGAGAVSNRRLLQSALPLQRPFMNLLNSGRAWKIALAVLVAAAIGAYGWQQSK